MAGNAIDLTDVASVKSWVGIATGTVTDDSIIQDIITAFSSLVIRMTGRGPANGQSTFPPFDDSSPFVEPQGYTEVYDGSGSLRQPIRNWPITAVSSLSINGVAIPQSTSVNVYGWVIDGDGKFISIRSGGGGYSFSRPSVRVFAGGAGFTCGIQNVEISYTAGFSSVPYDLAMAARKQCGLNYKRRQWIGQKSQAMAQGAGSVFYGSDEMDPDVYRTIMLYQRRGA